MNNFFKTMMVCMVFFIAITIFYAGPAEASHFRYGTVNYEPTGNPGEVEFNLQAAFRRDGYSGSHPDGHPQVGDVITETIGGTGITFGDGGFTGTLDFEVTAFDQADNWIIGSALDPSTNTPGIVHSYAGAGPYTAAVSGCCRIGALNNRSSGSYLLETIVEPQSGNNSPVTTLVPIVNVPESATAHFFVPAVDPDGDGLQWRMSTNTEAGGGPHPPNFSIDPNTGEVTWNNVGLDQVNYWTTQVVIEDLDANGQVISKTPVDFFLKINPVVGNPPSCSISPMGPLNVAVGSPVSFTITGTDPDPGDSLSLNTSGLPGGATMTPALPFKDVSPISSTFNWTPGAGDIGSNVVLFSVTDSSGQQSLCSININVQAQQEVVFLTCGSGDEEVPPVSGDGEVGGMFVLNETHDSLFYYIRVTGLTGPLQAAHFHNAAAGTNGGVVKTLTGDFVSGQASGVWTSSDAEPLTAALVSELMAGNIYVNIHTAAHPGGEVRGQLESGNPIDLYATLEGGQEVPPNSSTASGSGIFELSADGSSLNFDISYNGLSAPMSAAHFHNAPSGTNGGVVRTLTGDFVGNNAVGVWTDADAEPLTPMLVAEVLGGGIYVNVHTSTYPGGEIRGQLSCQAPLQDGDAPTCDLDAVNPGPPVSIDIRVQDMQSGIASIIVLKSKNATVNIPAFTPGDTGPIMVSATKIDNSKGASVALETMDMAGNTTRCDPVYTKLSSVAPESFELAQNYPNPFNPSTTIHFNVPATDNNATAVEIVVYDLTGREVATLVNDVMQSGQYSVQWDGTNSNGKHVAGGVYIYRMVAGDFVQTRKMILMK
ncbi:MAG: CHRD domain-containing protein [Calditrichia bacterium]